MKNKILSCLLALLLIFALCVPAFADNGPIEVVPDAQGILYIQKSGNYIISQSCEVSLLLIGDRDVTLTIAPGVTVTTEYEFTNFGTLDLRGTLNSSDSANAYNNGTIHMYCTGKLSVDLDNFGEITDPMHEYVDGVCTECGKAYDPNEPVRIRQESDGIQIREKGSYYIDQDCSIYRLVIDDRNAKLTIAEGVTVTVTGYFTNFGTIDLCGTLDLSKADNIDNYGTLDLCGTLDIRGSGVVRNNGTIHVGCAGDLIEDNRDFQNYGGVEYASHTPVNGVCTECGRECGPNEPIRLRPGRDGNVSVEHDSYIIKDDCTIYNLQVYGLNSGNTLTIAPGVTVTVTGDFGNSDLIEVYGTLDVSKCRMARNDGKIRVACSGELRGNVGGRIERVEHSYVCSECGAKTGNATGSVISEGSLTILVGVAAAALFGLGGFLLGRKKKQPAAAHGEENE